MSEPMVFEEFPSITRLFRTCVISEKIDGDNGVIAIGDDAVTIQAGSRSRWVTPEDDNKGFARWVQEHREELLALGPGRHHGEWWGAGIRRRYGQKEKRFSLFNVSVWGPGGSDEARRPACCGVVPVLYRGPFTTEIVREVGAKLKEGGSVAAPGFMDPEGVVVWHDKARVLFKYTLDGDGHKGEKGA